MEFRRLEEAESYLRFWRSQPGAMEELRYVLRRRDRGAAVQALSDDAVIKALAMHLMRGSLVVTESMPTPPRAPKAAAAPAAAEAAMPSLPASLPPRPDLPKLPILEAVQIQGAQVLPEVLQTLEQLHLTMANVTLTGASLTPAASGVPAIGSAIDEAGSSITATLDSL